MRSGYYAGASILATLLAWEAVVRLGNVSQSVVPPVSDVFRVMFVDADVLSTATIETLQGIALGYGAAVVVSLLLATAIVAWRPFENAVYPILVATQAIPKIAIAPLLVVWFGFGMFAKVVLVFLICFFPIVVDTVIGLKSLNEQTVYLARSMGAPRYKIFFRLRFVNALPDIFGGLKVAAVFAVSAAVIAEYITLAGGTGSLLVRANAELDTERAFAIVGYLTIVGIVIFYAIELLEARLVSWHVSRRSPVQ
ncbi:MAG: NitT/TauT family transport system permease protein [Thermoleophilaceae bacterium]|jgi:NitT/TauT family transport system permease protein|nr:NitT/TauT family transport system permease protein [Thermoleophilaceae bacterium]